MNNEAQVLVQALGDFVPSEMIFTAKTPLSLSNLVYLIIIII